MCVKQAPGSDAGMYFSSIFCYYFNFVCIFGLFGLVIQNFFITYFIIKAFSLYITNELS